MNSHNIKTDKLDLMGWIYSVQDVSIIETLKEFQKNTILNNYEVSLKPMTIEELVKKAKSANSAIDNGEVTSQEDLRKDINNW